MAIDRDDTLAFRVYERPPIDIYRPHTVVKKPEGLDWLAITPVCVQCQQRRGDVDLRTGICATCATPAPTIKVKAPHVYQMKPTRERREREPKFDADMIAAWITDHQAGMSLRDIGEKYGAAHQTVRRHLAANGIKAHENPVKPKRELDPELIATIGAEYEAGATILELSKRHHRSQRTVRACIVAAGLTVRPANRIPVIRSPKTDRRAAYLTDDDIVQMAVDYQNGMGLRGIAEKYHIGDNRSRRILIAAGVTIRPIGVNPSAPKDGFNRDNHPSAKVTQAQHDEILARLNQGERPSRLAPEYGITASAISMIKARAKDAA